MPAEYWTIRDALEQYARELWSVQIVYRAWQADGSVFPDGLRGAVASAMDSAAWKRDHLVESLYAASEGMPETQRRFADNIARGVALAHDETADLVSRPWSLDESDLSKIAGAAVGMSFWRRGWQFVKPAFESAKKFVGWCLGIAVGGTAVCITGWFMYSRIKKWSLETEIEMYMQLTNECERMASECNAIEDETARRECIENANAKCAVIMDMFKQSYGGAAGECDDLFDTPMGTLLGGLAGVGIGWYLVRRLLKGV